MKMNKNMKSKVAGMTTLSFLFLFMLTGADQSKTLTVSAQTVERGKLIIYKYQQKMGEENYEITSESDALVLKTDFKLNFVGDDVPVTTTLRVRKDDLSPLNFETNGKTSTRTEVDAAVNVQNGMANMRSGQETKSEKVSGKFFTVAHPAPIAPQMMLFRYWKKNNIKDRLRLLPGGSAKIEFLGRDKVAVNGGEKETLERYCIEGVMWGCQTVWFDARQNLVALVAGDAEMDRFEAVREGYESQLPFFVRKGAEDAVAWLEKLNREIKPVQTGKFAVIGGLLVDGRGGEPVPDSVVLIDGGKILAAGKRSEIRIPKGYRTVDAKGKTVLPGLFDTHQHATQAEWFPAMLAAGVTTARDAANEIEFIVPIRDAIKEGRALGPRLLLAGYIDSGEHPLGRMTAETPEQAKALVNQYKNAGFEQIKIYQSLKPELVKIVTDEAHRLGMTVTGHVPTRMNIYGAVENGFDQVNHINFAFRAMLPKDFKPTPGQQPKIDPESEAAQEGLKFLRDRKIVFEPTLARSELNIHARTKPYSAREPGMFKAPYEFSVLLETMGSPPEAEARAEQTMELMLKVTKALYKAGVPLLVGTDLAVPGHTQFREMELLVKAGLSPIEAIQAATIVPARVFKLDKELGTIEAGKIADVILVDGNPLENISNVRKVKFAIANGRMYDTDKLWRSIRFQP
jgi:imidazolonepropionase-like amidohydrolase